MNVDKLVISVIKVWSGDNATRLREADEACAALDSEDARAAIKAKLAPLRDAKRAAMAAAKSDAERFEIESEHDKLLEAVTEPIKQKKRELRDSAISANQAAIAGVVMPDVENMSDDELASLNAALGMRMHAIKHARMVVARLQDERTESAKIVALESELAKMKLKRTARQVIGVGRIESAEHVPSVGSKKG